MHTVREIIKKYNITPSKSLGQNFLIDENIVYRIIEEADISKDDMVIEIGPGLGGMTTKIAEEAGRVVAVEIDKKLIPFLKDHLKDFNNIEIINSDVLKIDINREIIDVYKPGFKNVKIVSNLPYYITTPIIMKLLEEGVDARLMIFMMQLEVADRMVANPGVKAYGALSVAVRYYSEPEKLFTVYPHSFIPQPAVDSAVIRLSILNKAAVDVLDRNCFFKTVKASFGQRRKTLVNALVNSGFFKCSKDDIKEIITSMGLGEDVRGETLSIDKFALLSNKLLVP